MKPQLFPTTNSAQIANREKYLARAKARLAANYETILAYQAQYYKENTGKVKANVLSRNCCQDSHHDGVAGTSQLFFGNPRRVFSLGVVDRLAPCCLQPSKD